MSGVEENPVPRCPKCDAPVRDWRPYARCAACKEPFSAAFDAEMEARLGLKPGTQKTTSPQNTTPAQETASAQKTPQPLAAQQWRIEPAKDGAVAFDCPACHEHYRFDAAIFAAKPDEHIEGLTRTDQVVGRVFGQQFLAFVVALIVYYYAHQWIYGRGVPLNQGILIPVFIAVAAYTMAKPLFAAGLLTMGKVPVYRYVCPHCQSEVLVGSDGRRVALPVRSPAADIEPKRAESGS